MTASRLDAALDYAASVATLPYDEVAQKVAPYLAERGGGSLQALLAERGAEEEGGQDGREVQVFLVGTGMAPGLERLVSYLSGAYGLPVSAVVFQVFGAGEGWPILVRELQEGEIGPQAPARARTPEDTAADAERAGVGEAFRVLLAAARRHGMYARAYKQSVMYTPPSRRNRCLFTVQAAHNAEGKMWVWVETPAFARFYDVSDKEATALLGEGGWRAMDAAEASAFAEGLGRVVGGDEGE